MNILVLAPMTRECDNFTRALRQRRKLKNQYKVVNCGVGKVNAAYNAALELFQASVTYDLVAVIGYAAASPYYKQGDFVMPSSARYHDARVPEGLVDELTRVYDLEGFDDCTILTGDAFVDKVLADELTNKYGLKVLFDMEATAVAQVCDEANVPLLVYKFISDIPQNDHNYQSFDEFVNSHTDFTQFVSGLEIL